MERKRQLLLIALVAALLLGVMAWFNFGPRQGGKGPANGRGAFAQASPTPKANARQKADATGQISTVEGSKLVSIKQTPAPEPTPAIAEKPKPRKFNYGMIQFFSAVPQARPVA